MGQGWLTEEQVEAIISSYQHTKSIMKTVDELTSEGLHLSEVKVRRVLITEGLWSSETSESIGERKRSGMSTAQIAEKLGMSVKNVQAYMPYENGAYGEESKNARDSRRSREKARMKGDELEMNELEMNDANAVNEMSMENVEVKKERDAHDLMKYAIDYGQIVLLLDAHCVNVNGLSVVRPEVIEMVREYEKEFYAAWDKKEAQYKQSKEAETEEQRKAQGEKQVNADKIAELYARIARAKAKKAWQDAENPLYHFVYIDCAPEALEYSSPGMPEYDIWLPSWLLERARDKERKRKKLTYSQFIDRLSMCVCGRSPSGSAYEKTLQTNVELLRDKYALVFVNFHLLCDRSGGKKGVYTAVGDMVGTVRQIWDSTHTPMMFLASEDFVKVMDKDDEGRKLNRRVGGATRV